MYRGLPPIGQLRQLSDEDQLSLIGSKRVNIKISGIKWHFTNFDSARWAKIETFIKLEHSTREFPGTRQITFSNLEGTLRKWF